MGKSKKTHANLTQKQQRTHDLTSLIFLKRDLDLNPVYFPHAGINYLEISIHRKFKLTNKHIFKWIDIGLLIEY